MTDRPRAKFPRESRPLPPVRTLRGDTQPVADPSAARVAPVRSGLRGDPLAVTDVIVEATAEPGADVFAGLEIRTGPLPAVELPVTLPGWKAVEDTRHHGAETPLAKAPPEPPPYETTAETLGIELVPEGPDPEIVLHDEIFWLDEDVEEGLPAGATVEPLEGLTSIGDVGAPVTEPAGEPPSGAVDEPPGPAGLERHQELPTTEWEALGQPLEASLTAPEIRLADEAGVLPRAAEPGPGEESGAPDVRELASRLERLADQIRMHGSDALEAAQSGGDTVEREVARLLAGLLGRI